MVARVTLAEVDTVRISVARAVEQYEESVLPEIREQAGYEGSYVLTTPEGKALVIGFWSDQASADASVASGIYGAQVAKFVTFLRSPPGREMYDVAIADTPALTAG